MKNGPCPKCGSKEIYVQRNWVGNPRNVLKLGMFSPVNLREYICAECGFVETYLDNLEDASKIIDKCEKV